MQFQYRDGQELSMSIAGDPLWSYRFATDRQKPFIHPLRTPGGVLLTAFEPWDHQWHRGLWFSWQYINDVNYWEEQQGIPAGVGAGTLHFTGPEQVTLSPRGAEIRTHYEHRDHTGLEVLESVRELHFHIPKKDRYLIDWTLSWNAKTDLVIRRTPEDWGGYSGLSIRTARTLGSLTLLNSEGQQATPRNTSPRAGRYQRSFRRRLGPARGSLHDGAPGELPRAQSLEDFRQRRFRVHQSFAGDAQADRTAHGRRLHAELPRTRARRRAGGR
ncbi:MAG: hypothetical protein HC888_18565 [Candidatus Competibacteraceae bacterium]|nr:hypothetical protein [Candidatus Competibacteraceae bacterium]